MLWPGPDCPHTKATLHKQLTQTPRCMAVRGLTGACLCLCRVHTVAFPVVQEVNELFRATDAAATAALLAKLAVEKSYSSKLDETRAAIQACSVARHSLAATGFECLPLACMTARAVLWPVSRAHSRQTATHCEAGQCIGLMGEQNMSQRVRQAFMAFEAVQAYHRHVCGAQHKLSMALKEFRVMHAAASRGNLPHHQLIYPPSLRYLPIWTLGALAHWPLLTMQQRTPCHLRQSRWHHIEQDFELLWSMTCLAERKTGTEQKTQG